MPALKDMCPKVLPEVGIREFLESNNAESGRNKGLLEFVTV